MKKIILLFSFILISSVCSAYDINAFQNLTSDSKTVYIINDTNVNFVKTIINSDSITVGYYSTETQFLNWDNIQVDETTEESFNKSYKVVSRINTIEWKKNKNTDYTEVDYWNINTNFKLIKKLIKAEESYWTYRIEVKN